MLQITWVYWLNYAPSPMEVNTDRSGVLDELAWVCTDYHGHRRRAFLLSVIGLQILPCWQNGRVP